MKELVPRGTEPYCSVPMEDLLRIVNVCQEAGYFVTIQNARSIWELFSREDGWLSLPIADADLLTIVLNHARCS
jgi:hypothetical protein